MKRYAPIAILFACVVLAAPPAHAEGYAGFRVGGHRAVFTGGDAEQLPWSRVGFTGGVFIGFDSGQHLGFRTDLLYTQKGGQGPEPTVEAEYLELLQGGALDYSNSLIKIDYIEMAPLLVARFPLTGRFSIRGFVGPVLGLWINAEAAETLDQGGQEYHFDVDLGDIVEHWEFGATIGVELNAAVGPYVVLLESRYGQGSRVFEDVGLLGEPLDFNASNSGLSVMAGLMVPF
ncbi:MAG TPA: outer membrane beta-barrel protein [Candidatus Krumholzibacteria bacterium]|nr:outer membrane beta-barrel protein [Candidatus Krumholzibacteria bacterium]